MTEDDSGLFDDSRRSFMKKGAVATTALALGAGATGTATAQADGQVLVYGDDYRPGQDFTVVSALNTQTKDDLIEESGATDDVFDDPDDWEAYIISYDLGTEAPTWGFLFSEEITLSSGDSETMGNDGEFREPAVDLIEVTPGATGNGGDGEDGGDGGDGDNGGDGGDGGMEDGDGGMEDGGTDGNGGAGGNDTAGGGGGGGGGGN